MKPYVATLINAILLIAISLFGYFSSPTPSFTAFIPAIFGLIFLIMIPGLKKENKIIAHVSSTLLIVLLIALIKPLTGAIGRMDHAATWRIGIMLIATLATFLTYLNQFIQVRRNRKAQK